MIDFNIQKIEPTDTIGQFMEKCNDNFALIRLCGGPKGDRGKMGDTGATGKRGNLIKWIDVETEDSDFDITEANEILNEGDYDLDCGDVVVFSNNYIGVIDKIGSEDEYEIKNDTFKCFKGERGPKGNAASGSSDNFHPLEGHEDVLVMNEEYKYLSIPFSNEFDQSQTNTLCINCDPQYGGGIGFMENGQGEISAIKMSDGDFLISSETDLYISTSSNKEIKIGNNGNSFSKQIDVSAGDNIKMNVGGINYIEIGGNQNQIKVSKETKFENKTTISDDVKIIGGNGIEFDVQSTSQSVTQTKIKYNGITTSQFSAGTTNDNKFKIDANGITIGDDNDKILQIKPSLTNTEAKIEVKKEIDTTKNIYNRNNNVKTLLDIPKYSTILYQITATLPEHWYPLRQTIFFSAKKYSDQSKITPSITVFMSFIHGGIKYYIYRPENIYMIIPKRPTNDDTTETTYEVVPFSNFNNYYNYVSEYGVNSVNNVILGNTNSENSNSENSNSSSVINIAQYNQTLPMTSMSFASPFGENNSNNNSNTHNSLNDAVHQDTVDEVPHEVVDFFDENDLKTDDPYANYIKNFSSETQFKDLSNVFTKLDSDESETEENEYTYFCYIIPDAPNGFVFIFKNE